MFFASQKKLDKLTQFCARLVPVRNPANGEREAITRLTHARWGYMENTVKNTVKTRTNNTRTNSPALEITPEMVAAITAQVIAAITGGNNTPALVAPEAAVVAPSTRVKKQTPAKDAKKAANAEAWRKRVQAIEAAKEQGATRTYAQALGLAAAQVVHNRTQALAVDPKSTCLNAKIFATSPASVRVWLTSTEHQAYKAARDAHEITPADSESNLTDAVAKLANKKTRVK